MTDREFNIVLREMARSAGLCDQWYSEWKDDDTIDTCLERYVKGHDFAVKHNWPPIAFIRCNFKREDLHRHNIYIDEDVRITDAQNGTYIFLGECKAEIKFDGFKTGRVYARHHSDVHIEVRRGARCFATMYEDSLIRCSRDETSKCMLYDRRKKEGD